MMNEDYLWDKTGNDPEIEDLENALQAFRYADTAAPALPAKVIPVESNKRRSFFRLGLAFAACLILTALGAGIWQIVFDQNLKGETALVKAPPVFNSAPLVRESSAEEITAPVFTETNVSPATAVKSKLTSPNRKFFKTRESILAVRSEYKLIISRSAPDESVAQLTGEEKYAYDQLMLALSITSSKLKIVKDKVEGSEKSHSVQSYTN